MLTLETFFAYRDVKYYNKIKLATNDLTLLT